LPDAVGVTTTTFLARVHGLDRIGLVDVRPLIPRFMSPARAWGRQATPVPCLDGGPDLVMEDPPRERRLVEEPLQDVDG
jgi:hypothetical protein